MKELMCKYDPKVHFNHKKPWTTTDQNYLVEFYGKVPVSELCLSLGRTYKTITDKVCTLRKRGEMAPAKVIVQRKKTLICAD